MLAVVSDRKKGINDKGTMVYVPEILSYADYSPYGTLLHARHSGSDGYRYGFQGQEMDNELKGDGNSVNYKYRMHDPRIGRFFAIDPLAPKYPFYSPYAFSGNQVIHMVELEGLEPTESGSVGQKEIAKSRENGKIYHYTWGQDPNISNKHFWLQGEAYEPSKEEMAQISEHVYNLLKTGYDVGGENNQVPNTKYNLIKEYTEHTFSEGYKAGLYARVIDGVYFYVFATAGTDDMFDAGTDVDLVAGLATISFDYSLKHALRIDEYVKEKGNGNNLYFTGHSLGGGMASANALKTGRSATTFNAASITNIKDNYGLSGKIAKIDAYIISGEAVDFYQRNVLGIWAEGSRHYVSSSETMIISYDLFTQFLPKGTFDRLQGAINYKTYVLNRRIENHSMNNFLQMYK